MGSSWPDAVAAAFSLGDVVGPPTPLPGGRAHSVWRLKTSRGVYVAKALNPFHTADAARLGLIRDKIRLESAANDHGVRMPNPVPTVSGDLLARLPGRTEGQRWWRVHEWVEGQHPGWEAATPEIARWVGESLAVVHRLASVRTGSRPTPPLVAMDQWRALAERSQAADAPWAQALAGGMDAVAAATEHATGRFSLDGPLLRSHCECDQRNAMIDGRGLPYLLDWDSLIYLHPAAELLSAAVNWAGANTGRLDLAVAAETIHAYRDAGGRLDSLTDQSGPWLAWQLGWLWSSAHRALGDDIPAMDLHDHPADDVTMKLRLLPQWLSDIEEWAKTLSGELH